MASKRLISLWEKVAELTKTKCTNCRAYCCDTFYCEQVIAETKSRHGIDLERTKNVVYPLLNEYGACTAAPYLRPICAIHTCEKFLMKDATYCEEYMKLRYAITELEYEEAK